MAHLYHRSVRELGPRRYTPEQVAAWSPAVRDPALVHRKAADGRTTLIAVDTAGEIVGYGDLETDGHVDYLYCSREAAGNGVADALLTELVACAKSAGMPRLYTEASELARSVFARHGFTLLHRRDFERRGVMIHNYAMERLLGRE